MGLDIRSARRWACGVLVALGLAVAAAPAAAVSKVDPGELPTLKADEGLLVVAIDSDSNLSSARFDREGSNWTGGTIRGIKEGRTLRLFRVPAGRYRWMRITQIDTWSFSSTLTMDEDDEVGFEVKPGRVNYAGDLVYRTTGFLRASVRLSNRALPVLDWMDAQHPQLLARHEFAYTGHYPDPFPAFYAGTRGGKPGAPAGEPAPAAPRAPAMPLPPRELWTAPSVGDVTLSPDGRFIAMVRRDADAAKGWWVEVFDIDTGHLQRVAHSPVVVEGVNWESERTLLLEGTVGSTSWLIALHVGDAGPDGRRTFERVVGPTGGTIVDYLRQESGVVLYQSRDRNDQVVVHRLDLRTKAGVRAFGATKSKERLNVGVANDLKWFADGAGRLRAAYARKGEEDVVLMHGGNGVFREVMPYEPDGFQPLMLSFDGERFYGLSDKGRAQTELVEFDPAAGQVLRTIHGRPGVDLVSAVFDEHRRPIGAVYYEDGRRVTEYFTDDDRHMEGLLRKAFPGMAIAPVQRSREGSRVLLWVDGSDRPPQLFLLDRAKRTAELIGHLRPMLAERTFAPATVVRANSSDGLPVQAFLTLPRQPGKRPLVVMPHGGPIGISDTLHFDPEVQFLASLGYAVLQVNFRGSAGYGKAFREAGHRNYGKLIEDDIDAALRAALAAHPLDESNMCLLGTSYGGYSAMVSTIRWPGRFRCAVSIAGVSDRALFFTASDSGRDADVRAEMEKIIGNPAVAADLADMQAYSPLYRYRDLAVPLMLVHGLEDARVDFEHSRRLARMLALDGRPPILLTFEEEGHGLEGIDSLDTAWSAIAGFLARHLRGGATAVAAPPGASSSAAE